MSKPTRMNLQLFAEDVEDVEEEVIDNIEEPEVVEPIEPDAIDINEARSAMGLQPKEVKVNEEAEEVEVVVEETTDDADLEKYDEITYNKEIFKKQHEKLTEYETKIKKLESLIGMDLDSALKQTEANKLQSDIDEYAETHNVSEEDAKAIIEKDRTIKQLEFKNKVRDHKDEAIAKKKELQNELYFTQLEPEIDKIIQENVDNGQLIDVETAYRYLLGSKAKELMEESKKTAEKRTIANIQDRSKRTVEKEAGSDDQIVVLSEEAKRMAREMGVSPKKLAERLAKKKRSER